MSSELVAFIVIFMGFSMRTDSRVIQILTRDWPKIFKVLLAITFAFATKFSVAQKFPPSDSDLRASYCFAQLSEFLQKFNFLPPEYLSETKDNRDRIYRYLVGRVSFIDSNGVNALILARQQALADEATWKDAFNNICGKLDDMLKKAECARDLETSSTNLKNIANRSNLCRDLSWLPF